MKTLFKNVKVYTLNSETESFKFLGVENDKIFYLSNEQPGFAFDRVIDCKNEYIYPCFTDSHLHLLYTIVLSAFSFNICRIENEKIKPSTIVEVEQEIKEYISKNSESKIVVVNQYIPSAIDVNRLPNRYELDSWSEGKEVVVFNIDGHSCSMSSNLLSKLNIESTDGILKGNSYDMNQGKVTSYIAGKASISSIINGVRVFTNDCIKYGIAKVCSLDGEDDGDLKDSLLSLLVFISRRLRIGVRLYPQYMNFDILKSLEKKMKNRRIGGCSKWELDGSVGSRSASFPIKYIDAPISNTYYPNKHIENKVLEAYSSGTQLTCHAIGTSAIDQIVNAYKLNKNVVLESGIIPRIDHFEFPSEDAVKFAIENEIGITIQPGYSYLDKRFIHSYTMALNQKTIESIMPLNIMSKGKCLLLGSSDSPVQDINPYAQMLGMIDYYNEKESMNIYDALKTYTVNPARVLKEYEGTLKVGGPATFFVTKYDILNTPKEDLINVRSDTMYINGKEIKPKNVNLFTISEFIFRKPKKI